MKKFTYLILSLLLIPVFGQSQSDSKKQIAEKYTQEIAAELGLTDADIENMMVTDVVHHEHNGVTTVYLRQTHNGICLLYTSPSPRDQRGSRMPSSA